MTTPQSSRKHFQVSCEIHQAKNSIQCVIWWKKEPKSLLVTLKSNAMHLAMEKKKASINALSFLLIRGQVATAAGLEGQFQTLRLGLPALLGDPKAFQGHASSTAKHKIWAQPPQRKTVGSSGLLFYKVSEVLRLQTWWSPTKLILPCTLMYYAGPAQPPPLPLLSAQLTQPPAPLPLPATVVGPQRGKKTPYNSAMPR